MVADLLTGWSWNPSVVGGIALLALAYCLIPSRQSDGPARDLRRLAFAASEVILLLALVSPLDHLADQRSLLAHMIQHLLLLLAVPTLFLASLPESFLRSYPLPLSPRLALPPAQRAPQRAGAGRVVKHPGGRAGRAPGTSRALLALASAISSPGVAFCVATGVLWFWHAPTLYEAALRSELLHAFEHLSFLASATLFWWPVLRPTTHPAPLPELLRIVYLFAAAVSSTLLSALITFSATVLYPTYLNVTPWLGLSPLDDQQIGGLLMWVVMGLWSFGAAAIVFIRWLDHPIVDDEPGSRLEPEGAT